MHSGNPGFSFFRNRRVFRSSGGMSVEKCSVLGIDRNGQFRHFSLFRPTFSFFEGRKGGLEVGISGIPGIPQLPPNLGPIWPVLGRFGGRKGGSGRIWGSGRVRNGPDRFFYGIGGSLESLFNCRLNWAPFWHFWPARARKSRFFDGIGGSFQIPLSAL